MLPIYTATACLRLSLMLVLSEIATNRPHALSTSLINHEECHCSWNRYCSISKWHAHAQQASYVAIEDLDPDIIGNVFPSGHTSAKILYDWWLCLLLAMGI